MSDENPDACGSTWSYWDGSPDEPMVVVFCEKKAGHKGDHRGPDPSGDFPWRWKNVG